MALAVTGLSYRAGLSLASGLTQDESVVSQQGDVSCYTADHKGVFRKWNEARALAFHVLFRFNPLRMCNRFVQKGLEIRPQQNATVLMKGPGGFFDLPFEAVFGGPARNESRNYWITREGAEAVIVPDIERFGERDKTTGQQNWEEVPSGSALEGLLLPTPPGKDYRLLKVVTQPATPDQFARLGNDRVPVFQWSMGGTEPGNEPAERSGLQRARAEQAELFP